MSAMAEFDDNMSQQDNLLDVAALTLDDFASEDRGFNLIYDREVPFEVRNQAVDEEARQGTLELIKIKLLLQGAEDSPTAIRLEMSSEADLFFHYIHASDTERFPAVQKEQKLMVDFSDYPAVLIKMLNLCIVEPHIHLGILTLNDNTARLDFIQNMEYKFIELLHCMCARSPDNVVQASITNRYNAMKQKMVAMQNRLQDIHSLIKVKNPSLLLQLQKAVGNGPAGTMREGAPSSSTMGNNGNSSSNYGLSPPPTASMGGSGSHSQHTPNGGGGGPRSISSYGTR